MHCRVCARMRVILFRSQLSSISLPGTVHTVAGFLLSCIERAAFFYIARDGGSSPIAACFFISLSRCQKSPGMLP